MDFLLYEAGQASLAGHRLLKSCIPGKQGWFHSIEDNSNKLQVVIVVFLGCYYLPHLIITHWFTWLMWIYNFWCSETVKYAMLKLYASLKNHPFPWLTVYLSLQLTQCWVKKSFLHVVGAWRRMAHTWMAPSAARPEWTWRAASPGTSRNCTGNFGFCFWFFVCLVLLSHQQ
jgi:hypothetical protein